MRKNNCMEKNDCTNGWHKCRTAKVISKNNSVLLNIINADAYKVEKDWLFVKDGYGKTHHYPAHTIREFETKD